MLEPSRIVFVLALFATIVLIQTASPQTPAIQSVEDETTEQKIDRAVGNQGNSNIKIQSTSPQISPAEPATKNQKNANPTQEEAENKHQELQAIKDTATYTWYLVIVGTGVGIGTVLVLFVQSGALYWQALLTGRTIKLAREEFISAHRPKLEIKWVNSTINDPNNQRILITFGVVNTGLSNGTVLGSSVNAEFLPDFEWPNPHTYPINNVIKRRRFVPGATDRYVVAMNEFVSLLEVYAEGMQHLRFYGHVVYRDDLGNTRTTYFCRRYDRSLDRFIPVDNPDYESTD